MFLNKNKLMVKLTMWLGVVIILAITIPACKTPAWQISVSASASPTLSATSANTFTVTPSPTLTKTPKPAHTITRTLTPEPLETHTIPPPTSTFINTKTAALLTTAPTLSLTPTNSQIAYRLPLRQAILAIDDLYQLPYSPELSLTQLYIEPHPVDKDVTDEVGKYCLEDCAKRVWIYKGNTILTILLVKTSSENSAQKAVEDLARDYTNLNSDSIDVCNNESFQSRNVEFGLAEGAFIATIPDPDFGGATTVLASTYGSIYMLIVSHYGVAFDLDSVMHCVSVQFLGKYQVEKLINAGYTR
jgi:hypothetical protein